MATPKGLVVPNVKNCQDLTVKQVSFRRSSFRRSHVPLRSSGPSSEGGMVAPRRMAHVLRIIILFAHSLFADGIVERTYVLETCHLTLENLLL
jgi:hypothetical protein